VAVNRRVASSNLARGANLRFLNYLDVVGTFGSPPKDSGKAAKTAGAPASRTGEFRSTVIENPELADLFRLWFDAMIKLPLSRLEQEYSLLHVIRRNFARQMNLRAMVEALPARVAGRLRESEISFTRTIPITILPGSWRAWW